MRSITKIILHCSASDLERQTAKMIDSWHRRRGWKKIGYHFFIRSDGTVEEGRKLYEVGAHAKGHNASSVGICLAGDRHFKRAQFAALKQLLARLRRKWPNATVHAHNEFNKGKTCPNFSVEPYKRFYAQKETKWTTLSNFLNLFQRLLKRFSRS